MATGADGGNRTRITNLASSHSTIELHPHALETASDLPSQHITTTPRPSATPQLHWLVRPSQAPSGFTCLGRRSSGNRDHAYVRRQHRKAHVNSSERVGGIEPLAFWVEARCSTFEPYPHTPEPPMGIEPIPRPYQGRARPSSYEGIFGGAVGS